MIGGRGAVLGLATAGLLAACGGSSHASSSAAAGQVTERQSSAPMSYGDQAAFADGEMRRIAQRQARSDPQASVFAPDCTNDGAFFSCTVAYGPTSTGGRGYVFFTVSYTTDGPPRVTETAEPPTPIDPDESGSTATTGGGTSTEPQTTSSGKPTGGPTSTVPSGTTTGTGTTAATSFGPVVGMVAGGGDTYHKRPANLTERQRDLFDELLAQPLKTVRAYTLAQQFGSFYELPDPDTAEEYLRRWITEVNSSGLEPLIKFTRMLEDHWLGVIRWHHSKVSNGLLEGLNSLIQAAKRRARGYRSNRNFITMIYLIVGKLNAGPVTA
jgi:hypothetical protein